MTVSDERRRPTLALVVDDDPAWRDALKGWLEREGVRAVMLARSDWVIAAVELYRPDVIILDVNLPGASGLDVLGGLHRRWPELPVIVTTAFGGPAVAHNARRLGAVTYLEKPFRIAVLLEAIRRAAARDGGTSLPAQA
jgi:FixJ family two-component response regulator